MRNAMVIKPFLPSKSHELNDYQDALFAAMELACVYTLKADEMRDSRIRMRSIVGKYRRVLEKLESAQREIESKNLNLARPAVLGNDTPKLYLITPVSVLSERAFTSVKEIEGLLFPSERTFLQPKDSADRDAALARVDLLEGYLDLDLQQAVKLEANVVAAEAIDLTVEVPAKATVMAPAGEPVQRYEDKPVPASTVQDPVQADPTCKLLVEPRSPTAGALPDDEDAAPPDSTGLVERLMAAAGAKLPIGDPGAPPAEQTFYLLLTINHNTRKFDTNVASDRGGVGSEDSVQSRAVRTSLALADIQVNDQRSGEAKYASLKSYYVALLEDIANTEQFVLATVQAPDFGKAFEKTVPQRKAFENVYAALGYAPFYTEESAEIAETTT